jgi:hypothetical protein
MTMQVLPLTLFRWDSSCNILHSLRRNRSNLDQKEITKLCFHEWILVQAQICFPLTLSHCSRTQDQNSSCLREFSVMSFDLLLKFRHNHDLSPWLIWLQVKWCLRSTFLSQITQEANIFLDWTRFPAHFKSRVWLNLSLELIFPPILLHSR